MALFISVVCGSAAVLLHEGILAVSHTIRILGSGLDSTWYPWVVICAPAAGGLIAGLVLQYLTPQARGSWIPQVKLDLSMRGGVIPYKVTLGKLVATTVAVGSGGSGLAAAFNTPIARVTLIMEEVIGDLNTHHLSYLILAAIGATITTRIFLGDAPLFDVPAYALGHPIELGFTSCWECYQDFSH